MSNRGSPIHTQHASVPRHKDSRAAKFFNSSGSLGKKTQESVFRLAMKTWALPQRSFPPANQVFLLWKKAARAPSAGTEESKATEL